MPINPVSSSAGAAAHAVQQPKPQQAEPQKADASRFADEPARARLAERQQPEQAKPVLNAEGQKTGQIINLRA